MLNQQPNPPRSRTAKRNEQCFVGFLKFVLFGYLGKSRAGKNAQKQSNLSILKKPPADVNKDEEEHCEVCDQRPLT